MASTGAPKTPCRECGKEVTAREFHDYVECIRYRLPRLRLGDSHALADARSLLAYIDSKEAHRG